MHGTTAPQDAQFLCLDGAVALATTTRLAVYRFQLHLQALQTGLKSRDSKDMEVSYNGGTPKTGWFINVNGKSCEMDDLGFPPFWEPPIQSYKVT